MEIAIIGSGNIGGALAPKLSAAGHRVTVTSKSLDSARQLADGTGSALARTAADAARNAELVILAVPWTAVEGLARELAPVTAGKVVVDVTNPMQPDYSGPLFAGDGSGADRISAWLPEARVVKAFNTIFGSNLAGDGRRDGVRLDALVASDDAAAKQMVLALAAELGFDPVDAGPLANAGLLESIAWLNINLNSSNGWSWESGWKLVGAPTAAAAAPVDAEVHA